MSIETIRQSLPEYAKDIKLNLSKVLSEEGAEGLSQKQVYGIALASAYATKNHAIITAIQGDISGILTEADINAAKAAASIMGMNNIYYRFIHLVHDKEYAKLPAGLRMNIIANPGVEKLDFELMSLAVSAINGCGMCMDAHVREVEKAGISKQGVQSTIRIASVLHAVAQTLVIEALPA